MQYARTLVAGNDRCMRISELDYEALYQRILRVARKNCAASGVDYEFLRTLCFAWAGRSFFSTDDGRIGLAPVSSRPDDIICIFPETRTPFILRKHDKHDGSYAVLGDAYIDGIMHGEFLEGKDLQGDLEWFTLR